MIRSRLAGVALAIVVTAGCATEESGAAVTLNYAMWVANQVPPYQKCADAFHAKNPSITVKITQTGWTDYWQNLTTQVVSGEAPDVFRDSVAYYPTYQKNNQIRDITPMVQRDHVDLARYQPGLADLWVRDGKRYGLPLDWDTIAVVYNTELVKQAGVDLSDLSWNPRDGGDFERALAKLTVDTAGRRADQPGFDKNNVKTFGFIPDLASGANGQTSWGNFAVSNGFTFTDRNPFGTHYNYDDPRFVETIGWFAGLAGKGISPPYDKTGRLGSQALLESGRAAIGITGSWMATTYLDDQKQKFAFAPLPKGPVGRRSAINSVSDAIYAGTKHPEEAWKWVQFTGSAECQDLVADSAVVLPAIKSSSDRALAAHKAAGRDVQVFLDEANAPAGTFQLPLTDNAERISELVQSAMDTVWLGQSTAKDAMTKVNGDVNALFK
ncbi:ABC transporter substrate-binding protein [Actinocrispum wychmicini]|uniref:Multiple sugar transport system substrate-binding protein n=1 Tax=Actinocrispum wychmicini TaxID=1213861 RepID=A0A4R2J5V3_9PSEU|nr:sugar ABC transporter substrate-binding protein [Actinocrispum wychmicini]TCO54321.1 multiple sugar transport system substrate-binding protein [Actinocrispum wychmicini]